MCHEKTKVQISCMVTAQLISAFLFTTKIVQSLYFLNPKFKASSQLLLPIAQFVSDLVGNPERQTFSLHNSYLTFSISTSTSDSSASTSLSSGRLPNPGALTLTPTGSKPPRKLSAALPVSFSASKACRFAWRIFSANSRCFWSSILEDCL